MKGRRLLRRFQPSIASAENGGGVRRIMVVVALFSVAACSGKSTATAPSGTTNPPIQPVTQVITDPATGAATKMSVELLDITPAPAAAPNLTMITVGPTNCADPSVKCFSADLKATFLGVDNPNTKAQFYIYTSNDGVNPNGDSLAHITLQGAGEQNIHLGIWFFNDQLANMKYLLAVGQHDAGGTGTSQYKDPAEQGTTSFWVGYQKK
jgi:hypothetical protein